MKQLFKSASNPDPNRNRKRSNKPSKESPTKQPGNNYDTSKSKGGFSNFLKKGTKKTLGSYIKKKNWRKVNEILFNKGMDRKSLIWSVKEETGIPCLSLLCMMHPPVVPVIKLVDLDPGQVSQSDGNGRYPLHFAAGWGASPQVVSFLTAMSSDIATEKDNYGKTPLILACEHLHPSRWSDTGNTFCDKIRGPTIEVIEILVASASQLTSDQDVDNMKALDYCRERITQKAVIEFLEKATEIDLRLKAEIRDKRKRPKFRKEGSKQHLTHNCVTLWDGVEFTTKGSILEEREMNKRLMDFLNIEDKKEIIRDLDVKYLKKYYPQALHAAENGYLSCQQCLRTDNSLPSLVDVFPQVNEDISDCTIHY